MLYDIRGYLLFEVVRPDIRMLVWLEVLVPDPFKLLSFHLHEDLDIVSTS